jgi:hypothetical protein
VVPTGSDIKNGCASEGHYYFTGFDWKLVLRKKIWIREFIVRQSGTGNEGIWGN